MAVHKFFYDCGKWNSFSYLGNRKYTRLNFTTKLLEFKNYLQFSNQAFDGLLKLLTDVSPNKHM